MGGIVEFKENFRLPPMDPLRKDFSTRLTEAFHRDELQINHPPLTLQGPLTHD